jgi:hypothetical protein
MVTYDNLLTLILKRGDGGIGFVEWERMSNLDVFLLEYRQGGATFQRVWKPGV